jgi:hypothetical protein
MQVRMLVDAVSILACTFAQGICTRYMHKVYAHMHKVLGPIEQSRTIIAAKTTCKW